MDQVTQQYKKKAWFKSIEEQSTKRYINRYILQCILPVLSFSVQLASF